jgi:uncharacterized membrane protein
MEYEAEITINLPRARVIELFDNADNMAHWQPGLQSFEHISGEPGQTGAKSKLVYEMNGRTIEMVETITSRNLPDEFSGTYDAPGVHNILVNRFYEDGPDKTRWVMVSEFQFTNLLMKVMGLIMPGSFRKETMANLERFKAFAESA